MKFVTKTLLSASLMASLLLTGCSKPASDSATEADTPVIKIATEGAYAPFNFTDAHGNLIGFDVDIVNALCAEMKANCEIVAQDWDGIIPGLTVKKYDAIAAGMSDTVERREVVDFTEPYFLNSLVFVAAKDGNFNPVSFTDETIGAQRATISAQYLEDNYKEGNKIKLYDTQENAYLDLTAGRISVLLSDKVPALDWLRTDDAIDFEIKGNEIDIDDRIAIAVRKDDPLKGKFNAALAAIKANGVYDKISQKYFALAPVATEQPVEAEAVAE